ncbi:hypothetical protein [Methylobacterium sp. 17Sr1-1]|uniref:hypothetical protein n=1 Tax=Methylobacterium sp. 17Sr1-1 TaxID=2202826 RepID=UPI0013A578A3|nr:hypothetical protein [Methylobacterium sp. 17Sr1-1]
MSRTLPDVVELDPRRLVLLTLFAILLAACTPSLRGGPERIYPIEAEGEFVKAASGPESYLAYATAGGVRKRELRDAIVHSKMYGIDLKYSEYEAQLTRERQEIPFLTTVATLGLTTSAATVASTELKTILATAAAGLTGVREAYDRDILLDRTIALLEQQMRTQRKLLRARIIERLALGIDVYPLELALSDIESYYRAGTLTGALVGLSEDSGVRLRNATIVEDQAVTVRFGVTPLGPRIRAFWLSSPENRAAVESWLVRNSIDAPVGIFVRSDVYAAAQRRIAAELGITSATAPPRQIPRTTSAAQPPSAGRPQPAHEIVPSATSVHASRIRAFMHSSTKNLNQVENWLSSNNIGMAIGDFLRPSRGMFEAQSRMIRELAIP